MIHFYRFFLVLSLGFVGNALSMEDNNRENNNDGLLDFVAQAMNPESTARLRAIWCGVLGIRSDAPRHEINAAFNRVDLPQINLPASAIERDAYNCLIDIVTREEEEAARQSQERVRALSARPWAYAIVPLHQRGQQTIVRRAVMQILRIPHADGSTTSVSRTIRSESAMTDSTVTLRREPRPDTHPNFKIPNNNSNTQN